MKMYKQNLLNLYCFISDLVVFFFLSIQPASKLPVWLDFVQEISFLCNVFFVGEQNPNHLKSYEITQVNTASGSTLPDAQRGINDSGTTSKPQVQQHRNLHFAFFVGLEILWLSSSSNCMLFGRWV